MPDGTKSLPEPMLNYSHLNPGNKLQWNSNQNMKFLINENPFGNIVCKMAAILSRQRWVNPKRAGTELSRLN